MNYRTLGRTGLRVSEIGFGCGSIGGLMVRGSPSDQFDGVVHALELGVNYFDTAPQYGDGQSEINLGQVLKRVAQQTVVATKVTIGPSDIKDIKGAAQLSIETSLNRLRRQQVQLLQLHTPITTEQGQADRRWSVSVADVLSAGGIADAFESLRSQRLVQFLGFTGLGETKALRLVVSSGRFDAVQVYYNLLNPSASQAVPKGFSGQDFGKIISLAAQKDMGVIVIRVMAGGALGGPSARSGYAAQIVGGALVEGAEYERDVERAKKLDFLISGDVKSLPEAAVRFALANDYVSTVVVGFSDRKQIDLAVGCSAVGPISASATERLKLMWSTDFKEEK